MKRYFGIEELLTKDNARKIYNQCNKQLQSKEFSVRGLLKKMNVETVCTTDDPTDDLNHHQHIHQEAIELKVLPAFRPDKAILIDQHGYHNYIKNLSRTAYIEIDDWNDLKNDG